MTKYKQCPSCKAQGKDTSKDNLISYPNGQAHCFSCGYHEYGDRIKNFKNNLKGDKVIMTTDTILLPEDSSTDYPERVINWVHQYQLNKNDLLRHNVVWSNSLQRLIFPIYGYEGEILAWQGRSFHTQNNAIAPIPKWFGKGNLKDTFNYLTSNVANDYLFVVEDIVSAIKLVNCGVMSLPLYGSFIGKDRFSRIAEYIDTEYTKVVIWLDPDKYKEALNEKILGQMYGLNIDVFIGDKDPKEYTYDEINKIIEELS